MPGGINRVVLCGTIGRFSAELRYHATGTPFASFMLVIPEQTQEGKWYSTLVPCQVWGKRAERCADLEPGTLVLFEGRITRRQKPDKSYEFAVSGFDITPITALAPMLPGPN